MEGFESLAKQYEKMIWKIIHTLRIYKDQEEYFQTGLIALWEAYMRFDETKGSFTSYAYSYIRGKILTEMKKKRKLEESSAFLTEDFWELMLDENTPLPFEKEHVLSYCGCLTENQRKWMLYTVLCDLSIIEIAEVEKVSLSAVKAWRKGAKKKLVNQTFD